MRVGERARVLGVSKLAFDEAAFRHGLTREDLFAVLSDPVYIEREFQPARKGEGMNTLVIGRHPVRDELVEVVMRTDATTKRATVFHAMSARWKMLARIDDPTVIPGHQRSVMDEQLKTVGLDRHQPGSRGVRAQLDVLEQRLQERRSGINRDGLDRVTEAINQVRSGQQRPGPSRHNQPAPPSEQRGPGRSGPQL